MVVIEKRRKDTLTTYRARFRIKGFPEASATLTLFGMHAFGLTIQKKKSKQ